MNVCPKCGNPFSEGATRCWNKDCNALRFRSADWQLLTDRGIAVNHLLRRKNIDVDLFTVLPPIDDDQVSEFQKKTGQKLPEDFDFLVRRCAGGWRFHWSLYSLEQNGYIGPAELVGGTGGNGEGPFIGATENRSLLTIYEEFQEELQYVELDEKTEAAAGSLFPLYTMEGGGADRTVLRMDTVPEQVVFLDHEFDYSLAEDHVIANGFGNFLRQWSNMGFPACEYLQNGRLNDKSQQTEQWWTWLEERP